MDSSLCSDVTPLSWFPYLALLCAGPGGSGCPHLPSHTCACPSCHQSQASLPWGLRQTHGFPVFYPNIEKMPLSLQCSFVWCACVCVRACMHMCVCVFMDVSVGQHASQHTYRGQRTTLGVSLPSILLCLKCFVFILVFPLQTPD